MYRNRLRVIFLLGPLVFISSFIYSQGKIEGSVFDSQNNDPLPGANVFLKETTYGGVTDLQGKFMLKLYLTLVWFFDFKISFFLHIK